jgi:hypothetical protein
MLEKMGLDYEQADKLAAEGTICTFATSRKGVDARSRDVNAQNFTLQARGRCRVGRDRNCSQPRVIGMA